MKHVSGKTQNSNSKHASGGGPEHDRGMTCTRTMMRARLHARMCNIACVLFMPMLHADYACILCTHTHDAHRDLDDRGVHQVQRPPTRVAPARPADVRIHVLQSHAHASLVKNQSISNFAKDMPTTQLGRTKPTAKFDMSQLPKGWLKRRIGKDQSFEGTHLNKDDANELAEHRRGEAIGNCDDRGKSGALEAAESQLPKGWLNKFGILYHIRPRYANGTGEPAHGWKSNNPH